MPPWKEKRWEGGLEPCASFEFKIRVGTDTRDWHQCLFDGRYASGASFLGGKSWQEIVHEGSVYFPDARLSVVIEMRPAAYRRREKEDNN